MPTYNKAPYLRRTLSSFRHQCFTDYEIVLADDGSSDDTHAVVAEFEGTLPIRFLRLDHRGRSATRNRAVEAARGATIVFTDDDRIVDPRFLAEHDAAKASYDVVIGWQRGVVVELRPDVSLSPHQVRELGRLRPGWERSSAGSDALELLSDEDLRGDLRLVEALSFDDDWFRRFVEPAVEDYGNDISACGLSWMFGTTGNMSVSAGLLEEAAGFDESLTGWGLEDTELHYRLTLAGASTYVSREAVNYHQNHPRNEGELMHEWVNNALRVYEKHPTLEVALYLRLVLGKLSLREMDRIIQEARSLKGSALLANFEVLQRNHVLQLAEARRDTHAWATRRS
jgi:glycosyltransferase involved in cell wall biosynthesis